jgi:hypothetical protein
LQFGGSQFGTQEEDPVGVELGEGRAADTQVVAGIPGGVRWSSRIYEMDMRNRIGGRSGK